MLQARDAAAGQSYITLQVGTSVGYSSLSKAERKRVRKGNPVALNTANGIVQADEVLDIYVHDLGITIEFYLLPDVPPVISMGFLTKLDFEFQWKKF